MRPQHPVDGHNHIDDPRLRAPLEVGALLLLLMVALVFLMVCVAGAIEALGYR